MKFILISPKNRTAYNFRGELIKEIISKGYDVTVTGPDETDVDKITQLGADFRLIPMNKTGTNILGDLKYCRALYGLFKSEKPDAVLGYTVKPVIYGSIAAKRAGVKNINAMITGGGYAFTAKSLKARVIGIIVRKLYKIGLGKADNVIFQNNDDLNEFTQSGLVKRAKCYVVNGSGVNTERFTPKPYPEQPSFFMLSRLLKSKGVGEYLEAAAIAKKEHPEVKFYLLGKYETDMQDAIAKEDIEKYIKNGVVERFEETGDVRPYYEKCSVYVLPSYREGTPRTVLEAMAMARPIITTDTQGCRETVENEKNGFLVPVKDAQAIKEKMLYYIDNPDTIKEMGEVSRQIVEEKYDVGKVNQNMLKIMNIHQEET